MDGETLRYVETETPLRLGFGGGGTDLPSFYKKFGPGVVTSIAFNRYINVTVESHFYPNMIRANYRKTEEVDSVDKIEHRAIREGLKALKVGTGIQISSLTDVPSRGTGLGSSSSFIVGLLNALHTRRRDALVPGQLAEEAFHLEREVLKEAGGKQDQYIAEFGGAQSMTIERDGTVTLQPLHIDTDGIKIMEQHIMILWTGIQRDAGPLSEEQSKLVEQHKEKYYRIRDLGIEAKKAIQNLDMKELGRVVNEGWKIKGQLGSGITNPTLEAWREKILKAGAYGFRITGVGGGGFILVIADPKLHSKIRRAVPELKDITIDSKGRPGGVPLRLAVAGSRVKRADEW